MNSNQPEEISLPQVLNSIDDSIDQIQKSIQSVLSEDHETVIVTDMDSKIGSLGYPIEKAKFHILLAYTLNTLLFNYVKIQGLNPKEHAVSEELERIKGYFSKLKLVQSKLKDKPLLKVDKEAANRFIKHALASNSKDAVVGNSVQCRSDGKKVVVDLEFSSPVSSPLQKEKKEKSKKKHSDVQLSTAGSNLSSPSSQTAMSDSKPVSKKQKRKK